MANKVSNVAPNNQPPTQLTRFRQLRLAVGGVYKLIPVFVRDLAARDAQFKPQFMFVKRGRHAQFRQFIVLQRQQQWTIDASFFKVFGKLAQLHFLQPLANVFVRPRRHLAVGGGDARGRGVFHVNFFRGKDRVDVGAIPNRPVKNIENKT